MLFRGVVLNLLFLSASSIALADSGTPQEQDACRPDVRRFCAKVDAKGGDGAFLECLENNRDSLSKKCLAVLIDHGR